MTSVIDETDFWCEKTKIYDWTTDAEKSSGKFIITKALSGNSFGGLKKVPEKVKQWGTKVKDFFTLFQWKEDKWSNKASYAIRDARCSSDGGTLFLGCLVDPEKPNAVLRIIAMNKEQLQMP